MTKFQPKIALVGAGQIGGTLALVAQLKQLSNHIVLLDIIEGIPQGKSLDLAHSCAVTLSPCKFEGTNDLSADSTGLKGADIVIITAGVPRKPGMSRDDLLNINGKIIKGLANAIKKQCCDAFIILITNPLDAMVNLFQRESGCPSNRVVGMAGVLDTSRFKCHLSEALHVCAEDIHTMVLGGHGDQMVPLKEFTTVSGIPLKTIIQMGWIQESEVDSIIERTRLSGGEIVGLLKTGSAFYAPACAALRMAEAYIRDEKKILPCAAMLNGEYGVHGVYAGVPVIIGGNGVERIVELPLSQQAKEEFEKSVESVKELCEAMKTLGL